MEKFRRAWHGIVAVEVLLSLIGVVPVGAVGTAVAAMLELTATELGIILATYVVSQVCVGVSLALYRRRREERMERHLARVTNALLSKMNATNREITGILNSMNETLSKTATRDYVDILIADLREKKADKQPSDI